MPPEAAHGHGQRRRVRLGRGLEILLGGRQHEPLEVRQARGIIHHRVQQELALQPLELRQMAQEEHQQDSRGSRGSSSS